MKIHKLFIISANNSIQLQSGTLLFGRMPALSSDQRGHCKIESLKTVSILNAMAIGALLVNTKQEGTVVRWGSAYALSRIILLERFADSELVEKVRHIYEDEPESGVKNQYAKVLKKLKVL